MRGLKCLAWAVGAIAVGTAGVLIGPMLGWLGGIVCPLTGLVLALLMIEKAESVW